MVPFPFPPHSNIKFIAAIQLRLIGTIRAIWRGYKEIKDAGGWVSLVFAGMGIYRFCKYRISFSDSSMAVLSRYRARFEVAADTLHPCWREMLSIVDAAQPRIYTGHPHDWVISTEDAALPIPLRQTYLQWDSAFEFTHLDASVIDVEAWGATDPRLIPASALESSLQPRSSAAGTLIGSRATVSLSSSSREFFHICSICGENQSDDPLENNCRCFPTLYGSAHLPPATAVQIFRTKDGRNNGLVACLPFPRGTAIGEFVGLVTKGLQGTDIMQASTSCSTSSSPSSTSAVTSTVSSSSATATRDTDAGHVYQIWQGREGNYTRFVNHSCRPNSQFERFVWEGVQRIVLVSRGVDAGQEITVDYSDAYWKNLDKICLCGEACCRFRERTRGAKGGNKGSG